MLHKKETPSMFLSVRYRVTRTSGSDLVVKVGDTTLPYE